MLVRLAAEGLGLTETERQILVGEPLTPPRQPEEFWGSAPLAVLGTVQEMLDRSGLDYAELDALIATWFVDPADGDDFGKVRLRQSIPAIRRCSSSMA